MARSRIAFLALATGLAACSSESEDRIVEWFGGNERTIHVIVDAPALEPYFKVPAGRGRGASAGGVGAGMLHDPILAAGTVVLLPVLMIGAGIVGSPASDPEETRYDLSEIPGATSLFLAMGPDHDLPTLLRRELAGLKPAETSHHLVLEWPESDDAHGGSAVAPRTTADSGTATLTVTLVEYALVGRLADDPAVQLRITGITKAGIDGHNARFVCVWSWSGRRYRVSELGIDGAKLFRERVTRAANGIAAMVARDLQSAGRTCADPAYIWDDPTTPATGETGAAPG